jgi:folate-binding protein YgfZ
MSRKPRVNPLESTLQKHNARLGLVDEALGSKAWHTALDFGDPQAEREALSQSVGLVDASARGTVVVSGPDRVAWLHGLCTQDIKGLAPWHNAYACHIDIKGRIVADFSALALDELLVLDTEPGVGRPLMRTLRRYVVMEQVKLEDRADWTGTLELFGPQAFDLCAQVFEGDALSTQEGAAAPGFWGQVDCLLSSTWRLGVPGVRVKCPVGDLAALWEALAQAGARPCGYEAAEQVRVAHGAPRFGAELDPSVLFNEVELSGAVSFTKGCYLGQEVVERVDARGRLGRRLLGLRAEADVPLVPGMVICNDARDLGTVTSAATWQGQALGMGLVHRAANEPGTQVWVRLQERRWPALLVERLEMIP